MGITLIQKSDLKCETQPESSPGSLRWRDQRRGFKWGPDCSEQFPRKPQATDMDLVGIPAGAFLSAPSLQASPEELFLSIAKREIGQFKPSVSIIRTGRWVFKTGHHSIGFTYVPCVS